MVLLSSYGLRAPIIAEKAKEFIVPEKKKVLIVPFAGFDSCKTAKLEITEGLIPFGFDEKNILVLTSDNIKELKNKHFDLVYVPGGNPFKLLYEAKKYDLITSLKAMIAGGADYFGISGGADFLSENIEYLKLVEDCDYDLTDFDGLGIIKEKILCHVDQRDMAVLRLVDEIDERKTIFLRNDELYSI